MKETERNYKPGEVAQIFINNGIKMSTRRIQAMLKQDQNPNRKVTHFPNAIPARDWEIPEKDVIELVTYYLNNKSQ